MIILIYTYTRNSNIKESPFTSFQYVYKFLLSSSLQILVEEQFVKVYRGPSWKELCCTMEGRFHVYWITALNLHRQNACLMITKTKSSTSLSLLILTKPILYICITIMWPNIYTYYVQLRSSSETIEYINSLLPDWFSKSGHDINHRRSSFKPCIKDIISSLLFCSVDHCCYYYYNAWLFSYRW